MLQRGCYKKSKKIFSYDTNMEMQNTSNKTEVKLMTCQEVAELLRLKVDTIYSYISYKQLPENLYRKLGRKPIFIRDEVISWFLAGAKLEKRQKGKNHEEV